MNIQSRMDPSVSTDNNLYTICSQHTCMWQTLIVQDFSQYLEEIVSALIFFLWIFWCGLIDFNEIYRLGHNSDWIANITEDCQITFSLKDMYSIQ